MITATHLHKSYRKKPAVQDVSFEVKTGKVTGFLGPNGAGKSTTMRLMLGLDKGEGLTLYDEKPLAAHEHPSSIVGILLEAKAFHPTRSARNHLLVLAAAGGVPDARVDEVLDIVGLSAVARKRPGKFSLGMSQRLGIAAAILGKPKYLLLDEPANGLDPEGIAWLRSFIKDYAAQGNGVFVSSHLLSEMSQMADRIVVIGKGKMIANTSVSDMLAAAGHASVFVRVANTRKFKTLLMAKGLKFTQENGGFKIVGTKVDHVGRLAAEADTAVLELTAHSASLEEAFLDITADSQEYRTGEPHGK